MGSVEDQNSEGRMRNSANQMLNTTEQTKFDMMEEVDKIKKKGAAEIVLLLQYYPSPSLRACILSKLPHFYCVI